MADEPAKKTPDTDATEPELIPVPAPPMGREFWAVMALIGVLVLLIIYAQVQGITKPIPVNLTKTNWTLTYYVNESGTMIPLADGTNVTLQFGDKNSSVLAGYSGCNWYRYNYTSSSTTLVLDLKSKSLTKMHCTRPGIMQIESEYLHNLESTKTIKFRSDRLYLYDQDQNLLLVFRQISG
ncbi:MAG TPA: META domain-containing protein [Methanoregula sp.]|nr:META domain-containing protein [Methanoregula sp.]